jgi:hypothetical protein
VYTHLSRTRTVYPGDWLIVVTEVCDYAYRRRYTG